MEPRDDDVPSLRFDSADFDQPERFDRWRDAVSGVYELAALTAEDAPRFVAESTSWHLGDAIFNTGRYVGQQCVERTPQAIRRDQIDHYKVQCRLAGGLEIDAGQARIAVAPGDVVVEDLARPSRYVAEGGRNIVLYVAREALDDIVSCPGRLHTTVVRGPAAALLAEHLQSVARHLPELPGAQANEIAAVTQSLIAACVAPTIGAVERALPAVDMTKRRQICRYVECHLSERDLSAASICSTFRMSRATLYRLFAPLGGVQSFIRERRLMRAHVQLSSTACRDALTRVAEQHGFANGSVFSAAFKAQFGYSPSDARSRRAPAAAAPTPPPASGDAFTQWMRSIRA